MFNVYVYVYLMQVLTQFTLASIWNASFAYLIFDCVCKLEFQHNLISIYFQFSTRKYIYIIKSDLQKRGVQRIVQLVFVYLNLGQYIAGGGREPLKPLFTPTKQKPIQIRNLEISRSNYTFTKTIKQQQQHNPPPRMKSNKTS